MAKVGLRPVISIYSSFLQRGYDQLIHDIFMQKLPVTICIDRAGIVGSDGETHQGIFDLSYLSTIPNITIIAPKNFIELEKMLEFSVKQDIPICIRYPRGGEEISNLETKAIEYGKAEVIKTGKDITIIAIGKMVAKAIKIQKLLEDHNIDAEIINARFLRPLDKDTIKSSILKTRNVITIEDNIEFGGLATAIESFIVEENILDINFKKFAYPVAYIKQAKVVEIEEEYGLDVEQIVEDIRENILKEK